MSNIKFSVIIPVYNVEQYLKECIESILKQDYDNYELILVDDGSTDNGASVCKYYAESDHHIIFIQQINQGVSVARNTGLNKATGNYLLFVDADDWLNTCALHVLYRVIKKHNEPDIIQSGYSIQSDYIKNICPVDRNYSFFLDYSNSDNFINAIFSYCIKRSIVVESRIIFPVGIRYAEDLEFILKVFLEVKHIVCVSDVLYYYRIRPLSAMTVRPVYSNVIDNLKVADHLFEILSSRNDGNISFVKKRSIKIINSFFIRLSQCCINCRVLLDSTREYRKFYNKYKQENILHSPLYIIAYLNTIFIIVYLKLFWRKR